MKGFTLIDVLVGAALIVIVFLGIFTAYQLGFRVIEQNKNRITATAIANKWVEKIRSLPYESVGTLGAELPFAEGVLESTTSEILNNISYTVEIRVKYISDPADGQGADDSCDLDYKKVEVKVSWTGRGGDEVKLVTDIAPQTELQELASCQAQPGGILSIAVFDAQGQMVPSPLIEIYNPDTGLLVDSTLPLSGEYDFLLSPAVYKIVVSKEGYSTSRTYGTDEIAIPEKPHLVVLEGQVTEASFSIDRVSSFLVNTLAPWGEELFSDSFVDTSKVSDFSNVEIGSGEAKLGIGPGGYFSSGFLISSSVSPTTILSWDKLTWTDSEPQGTDLKCQLYYNFEESWVLIPDSSLPGNESGFDESPVDLTGLSPDIYTSLRIKASLTNNTTSTTPILQDWQLAWKSKEATSVPNADFHLQGAKIIGLDELESPVYKHSVDYTSDDGGSINVTDLEWDAYTFTIPPETGLDLVDIEPSPQPIDLLPDTNLTVELYLDSENSLLVTLLNQETLEPVFSAEVRLYSVSEGYDVTYYTDERGQVYFIPLQGGEYNFEISASGYLASSGTISVVGDTTETIKIEKVE